MLTGIPKDQLDLIPVVHQPLLNLLQPVRRLADVDQVTESDRAPTVRFPHGTPSGPKLFASRCTRYWSMTSRTDCTFAIPSPDAASRHSFSEYLW
jgi:hypothetical protein